MASKPYNILILFFSLAYMAITLDITGILQSAAFWVSNRRGSNGRKLFLYFYIMLTVLSVFLGNDPVILSGTAFLVYYMNVNEVRKAESYMEDIILTLPVKPHRLADVRACSLSCFIALAIQFHCTKYLSRKLDISGDLDVRAVLLDPLGACVGGALLGTCLIVIIVVSFFKVDVWKISLPSHL